MNAMEVSAPEIKLSDRVIYTVDVTERGASQRPLWFSTSLKAKDMISDRTDAAIVALLLPAMRSRLNINVKGLLSTQLLYRLNGPLQDVLQSLNPSLHRVRVECAYPVSDAPPAPGVATGFSAGIDSYATLLSRLFNPLVPEGLRITHLLFNNVGSHGRGVGGRAAYESRKALVRDVVSELRVPLICVDSNIDEFYWAGNTAFGETHTLRNASVAYLLNEGLGHLLYASGYGYSDLVIAPTTDIACGDPVVLGLLSTSRTTLEAVGGEMPRTEKTRLISTLSLAHESLDVCVSPAYRGHNCSRCDKCLRTLLTLEVLGRLGAFKKVFDLDVYSRERSQFIQRVKLEPNPLFREIRQLALARDFVPLRRSFAGLPAAGRYHARRLLSRVRSNFRSRMHRPGAKRESSAVSTARDEAAKGGSRFT